MTGLQVLVTGLQVPVTGLKVLVTGLQVPKLLDQSTGHIGYAKFMFKALKLPSYISQPWGHNSKNFTDGGQMVKYPYRALCILQTLSF